VWDTLRSQKQTELSDDAEQITPGEFLEHSIELIVDSCLILEFMHCMVRASCMLTQLSDSDTAKEVESHDMSILKM
jgi:hypothetical protein